ncbi:MAG: hypothetical protein WBW04_23195 [Nitrolancea sp.]
MSESEPGNWLNRFPWRLLRLGRSGSGRAFGVLSVWVWWERFTNWRFKVKPVGPDSFLLYSLSHYSDSERTLADGTSLHSGDPILELHFNNPQITRLISRNQFTPWKALKLAGHDIGILEEAVASGPLNQVKAIHAITLFASSGERLGFEVHELPHTASWALVRYFMVGLIALYHPDGWKQAARTRQTMWPGEMWMGIETIKRRAQMDTTKSDSIQE